LRRFTRARSLYYFVLECRRALWDSARLASDRQDERYAAAEDPWRYEADPMERTRHAVALEMLDQWIDGERPGALEIGCGEGRFTELLCAKCEPVLAVDISGIALERARKRLAHIPHVRFDRYDIRQDPAVGVFDVVVCMDVMTEIYRPLAKRRAMRTAANCVANGGALLVSEPFQDPLVERAAWAARLRRGAFKTLLAFEESGVRLVRRQTRLTERHMLALYVAST